MSDLVKETEEMGARLTGMFIGKNKQISEDERYSILKLAELCIFISKESKNVKSKS